MRYRAAPTWDGAEPARTGGSQRPGTDGTLVRLRGAALTYPGPPPVRAVRPTNLDIKAGEYVTVTGRSGSGKSSLLNLLGLLDRPTSGTYELAGTDTGSLPDRDRTVLRGRTIGFVFQAFHLMPHRTAEENVALALLYRGVPTGRRRTLAREALDRVGLAHRRHHVASALSGGEQQRAAIARAIVGEPTLLLCDEPTGNLDSQTAAVVLDLIDELRQSIGLTILLITHDLAVAARGRRSIEIEDGRLIEAVNR